ILRLEVEKLQIQMEDLEKTYKYMIGEDLDLVSFKKLQHLEKQMNLSARKIRSKMDKISLERIRSLRGKEQTLKEENAYFRKELDRSHKASDFNLDMTKEVNDKLETDATTQQDLSQTSLNL
ncbi:hypothetical protein KI387_023475, partial [Taxus chinensis]